MRTEKLFEFVVFMRDPQTSGRWVPRGRAMDEDTIVRVFQEMLATDIISLKVGRVATLAPRIGVRRVQ